LAAQLEQFGRPDEAFKWYERAWQLNPDLPKARVALAMRKMDEGDLDAAHDLLEFLEQPGAGQTYSLGPLEILAHVYQKRGLHEDVLRICEHLLAELPNIAEHHTFRKFVAKSEKALGSTSVLPPRQNRIWSMLNFKSPSYAPWQRWSAIGGVVMALVLIGLGVNNEQIRANRTLQVINAFSRPAKVAIDGAAPIEISGRGQLPLAEGAHHVQVSGPVNEEYDVDVSAGYFDRWLKSPAWVLNVGGAAMLAETQTVYAAVAPPVRLFSARGLPVRCRARLAQARLQKTAGCEAARRSAADRA